jgi:hypothetical protein
MANSIAGQNIAKSFAPDKRQIARKSAAGTAPLPFRAVGPESMGRTD